MVRILTLAFFFLSLFTTLRAQDVLVRKNGSIIEGKVVEVGVDKVLYKISKEADAANFAVRKNELLRIEFGNGQTIWFDKRAERNTERGERNIDRSADRGRDRGGRAPEYDNQFRKNKIDISPFKALDSGPGFGLSYERILDKNGNFGLLLPLTMTLPDSYYFTVGSDRNQSDQMYYFSPTLKVYPFGQRRVTYAIGPSLFAGVGKRFNNYTDFDPSTGVYTSRDEERDRFRMGMLVNNFVNFQITQHFQIGLNAGLGARYIDQEKFRSSTFRTTGMEITGEFNFNLGFRF
ncbi:hypothetical protein [Dyadobacter fermentans]|uniref:Outer membrane protein beta-barrel domain-containing protein n=1 Tax=Dyadobacter fermentans (strain ATCC 700827 / DSM 18053 / CIP 107007 / KCTC 52180 / NS114) TaxID=471854 RepID=C6W7V0_DYAFD|nr:hypothetical protein [Dyadobacter fermentans]ACT96294.1 hypothetical protein Dfer_5094 [Dyadobacter fermentans DSM 18053]